MSHRIRVSLLLAAALLTTALTATAQDPRPGDPGYRPPPPLRQTAAHVGSSPFSPPTANDTTFVVDQGSGLDTGCTFRSGGPLVFSIQLGRVVGNAAKLKQNGLLAPTAQLRMPAYDVDFDAVVSGINPERDRVYFNGHPVNETYLTGANNVWKLNEFQIPIDWVQFANDPGANGTAAKVGNEIRIEIDTANSGEFWCTAIDWAALSVQVARPVVLVHGIFSSGDIAWAGLWQPRLDALGLPNSKRLSMGNLDSIQNNAGKIATEVAASKLRWGVDKVNLVCHSKGGLDARHYAEGNPDISQVIQIGTPNAGSPLATLAQAGSMALTGLLGTALINGLAGPAGLQLTPAYMGWYNSFHGHNAAVQYTALAGDYRPNCFLGIFCAHPVDALLVGLSGQGDSIVPVSSVFALSYTQNRTFVTSGSDNEAIHTKLTEASRVFDQLHDRVYDRSKLAAGGAAPPLARTATSGGAARAGETQVLHFPLEAHGPAFVSLLFPSGDLKLTLISPSGQRFDPSTVVGRTDVSRERRAIPGGFLEVYEFNDAEAGAWTAEVAVLRVDDPSGKTPFALHAWLSGAAVTLDGAAAPSSVHLGEALELRATLKRGAVPLTGAEVSARVARPDGSAIDVALRDDGTNGDLTAGDGVYSGRLTATTQAGYYSLLFRAAGTPASNPSAFSRESFTLATVSASASRLNGALAARGVDTDGNGLWNQLVVDAGVDAAAAGTYSLYGILTDSHGNRHETRTIATLSAGTATVQLAFDGAEIYADGVDGPYTLSVLRLAEEATLGVLPLDEKLDALVTPAFGFREFEHPPIALAGTGTATGVDTSGNGLFDRFDITVDLDLDAADTYVWSARLIDPRGDEVGFASGSGFLAAGRQSIALSYPGLPIGSNGVDGPYTVADLLVFGTSSSLIADRAYTTDLFLARQFEGYSPDATPPTLRVSLTPGTLWPPEHQLIPVQAVITVTDDKDPNPTVKLISITSTDPDTGLDARDLPGDIQDADIGTDDRSFLLRAEKYAVPRAYRITYEARDAAGNVATATATILAQKPK